MKIRNGFVSNSSSSSFVVAFPRRPESREDLYCMMFENSRSPVEYLGDYEAEPHEIVERVWDDIQKQLHRLPLSRIRIGALARDAEHQRFWDEEWKLQEVGKLPRPWDGNKTLEESEREEAELDAWREQKTARGVAKQVESLLANPEAFVCRFEYSDNGEGVLGVVMEHGDIFERLPHFRIRHH